MSRLPSVLISGASLAGPTLAFWLNRHGFETTIVERAPEMRYGGYKIDLRGAAVTVAERMGLMDEIRALRTEVRKATFVDGSGKPIAVMNGDVFGGRADNDAEISRGDLSRLIYQATCDTTQYRFGDWITGIDQDEEGATVHFANSESQRYGLVIAADGLHSQTRSLVFGDESQHIHDLGHNLAVFSTPNEFGLDREEVTYVAPGRTSLLYATARDPLAKALFLFASTPLEYDRHDTDHQKRLLAEAFNGQAWQVPRLLEAMNETSDFYFDRMCQVRMDEWSAGRVAVVGDAAYSPSPASGQGTSLALVGAYVLAGELAAAAGDHRVGFARYESVMRPFVDANQQLAPDNLKGMVMDSAAKIWFQLRALKLMPRMPGGERVLAKIADRIAQAANAIELADYQSDRA